jgi:prepilin-type N-terminal cleavage/methylation domain-containing protein
VRSSRPGFTLLEIMMVLALIAIIFIGSAPLIVASSRERSMRDAASEIEAMVRAERHDVMASGERRVLEIRPAGFFEKGLKPREVLPMTKAAKLTFRAPGERDWGKPTGQEWEFSPIGMVTPLSVRLENGDYWMELDFDMLTGRLAEERYAF